MSRGRPPQRRWQQWQASPQVTRVLTPAQQQHGLTALRVHPACRDAFLELVGLLNAWGRLAARGPLPPECQAHWATWLDLTCLVRSYVEGRLGRERVTP